ncbi:MAG: hypothetical protein V2A58_05525, partial [Planctomycetota bacterium]
MLPYRDFAFNQAPVMPFVYGAVFFATGPKFLVARLLSVGFAMATVFVLGASLWREGGGGRDRTILAGLFVLAATGVPVFVSGISLVYNVSLGMLFSAIAFAVAPCRARGGRGRWLAAGVFAGLAFATRVLNVLVLPVLLAYALVICRRDRFRGVSALIAGACLGALPLVVSFLMAPAECWACVVTMHRAVGDLWSVRTGFFANLSRLGEMTGNDMRLGLGFLFGTCLFSASFVALCLPGSTGNSKRLLSAAMTIALGLPVAFIPAVFLVRYFATAVPFALYVVFSFTGWAWRRARTGRGIELAMLAPLLALLFGAQLWTVSFIRCRGLFSCGGVRAVAADARRLREILAEGSIVYTPEPCVPIEAGLGFDSRLGVGRVWSWYVAAGKADPCMLRLLRTPEELDSLFRSGIPDAGLLAEAGAA